MDYVVGSIAALISGNVTPNRPKPIRRALTPTKHQQSPNVTPKSEFVDDRSIFLSPTLQKKKAIVKKSPKRIFDNPDLDLTEGEGSSPKADKVKKNIKEELEADEMAKSKSSNKLNKSLQPVTPSKPETNDFQGSNENTPKKKKRKSEPIADTSKVEEMDIDKTETIEKTPKKKERRKSVVDVIAEEEEEVETAVKEPKLTANVNQEGKKKKKRKKKNKANIATDKVENENGDKENKLTENNDSKTETKSSKKKKNRKKNKKSKIETPVEVEQENAKSSDDETQIPNDDENQDQNNEDSDDDEPQKNEDDDSDEEVSNIANPNAITEKDSDSEHESDDEIESENEEVNNEVLKNDDADESSDDETEAKTKKGAKNKKNKKEVQKEDKKDTEGTSLEREVNTEEEVRRTLFVGNVPFSNKCKKEIKKIFTQYGEIETVRIRTVPVKDARVTPKLAVIKNEIHPDRSTVNVYVKFTDPASVERALAENNTVLNNHHLRVSRSGSTGVEHDPRCAVFLGNLPFGIEDETLRERFQKCGEIESVRIVRDKKTNAGKGFGYVNFSSKDGVELALSLSEEDLTVKNRIIRVKRCTQTLSKGPKNSNKSVKQGPRKDFGNSQGQNRNFGSNQNRNFGNQNRNGPNSNFGNNQGQNRNFGNNQGQNRNFGNNQGQNRNFGNNQGQNRNFGNNQGQNMNFGSNQGPKNFGNQNRFGNQGNDASGASRRLMNKRPHQESGEGPPNKKQHLNQPPREKKQRKEFVGITAEKKKKQKFDKNQKKKKVISEIMTKK